MKTISKLIGIFLLLAGFTACDPGDVTNVDGPFVAPSNYIAQADVFTSKRDMRDGKIYVALSGNGESNLIGDEFSLSLAHTQYEENGQILVIDGRFTIANFEGDFLTGTYTGDALDEGGFFRMSQVWQVEQSEGKYHQLKGQMLAILTDRNKDGTFEVEITGSLE